MDRWELLPESPPVKFVIWHAMFGALGYRTRVLAELWAGLLNTAHDFWLSDRRPTASTYDNTDRPSVGLLPFEAGSVFHGDNVQCHWLHPNVNPARL